MQKLEVRRNFSRSPRSRNCTPTFKTVAPPIGLSDNDDIDLLSIQKTRSTSRPDAPQYSASCSLYSLVPVLVGVLIVSDVLMAVVQRN